MRNRMYKRLAAVFLSVSLIFSMALVSSAGNLAMDMYIEDDVQDFVRETWGTSTWDGYDAVAVFLEAGEQEAFRVTDSKGVEFGTYGNWTALLDAFKKQGSTAEEYTIAVSKGAVIGTSLPVKAGKIILEPAEAGGILLFAGSTVNVPCDLSLGEVRLCVAGSEGSGDNFGADSGGNGEFQGTPININSRGKSLTLRGTRNIGKLKGSSAGQLNTIGDVEVKGALQNFRYLTVEGSLRLCDSLSAVANLKIDNGAVYLAAGKNFTVSNVDGGQSGMLVYPGEGTMPNVRLNGTVTGGLQLRQEAVESGTVAERYFTAGSRLLTAPKAGAEQFAVSGDRVCYKKGSVVYAGAEVLQLYAEGTYLGTYAQWGDMVNQIKERNQRDAGYRVVLLEDLIVNGVLSMPDKAKCAGITIENGSEGRGVLLKATGSAMLGVDLALGTGVRLQAGKVSGASRKLVLSESASVVTADVVTVSDLVMKDGALVQAGGKFTVRRLLEAQGNAELILTAKKGAAVRDTVTGDTAITVKVRGNSGSRITLAQNTTLFTVSGDSYAMQYCLLDGRGEVQALYRKGNTIRVQGTISTPVSLYDVSGSEKINLGQYADLTDIKKEIARRRDADAVYQLEVQEEIFVKGRIPFPGAGTYQELIFTGERILTTGNMTLTGNVTLHNEIRRVKKAGDDTMLPFAVNLAKYTLSIPAGSGMGNMDSVRGASGSCLKLGNGVRLDVGRDVKAETLVLDGILRAEGNIAITNLVSEAAPESGNRAEFRLPADKKLTIGGKVETGGQECYIINIVNDSDVLANIGAGTVMATAQYGEAAQFRTENTMPVTGQAWELVKSGTAIKTAAVFEGEGEWSKDYF